MHVSIDQSMRHLLLILLFAVASHSLAVEQPLSLNTENPHYFLFRGKPTILITSAEHYGAVLNQEFDFEKYLDELEKHGLNLTRTFTGVYCEDTQAFNITRNTLAPSEGELICPWARSDTPGYAGGGNKFDLSQWNDAYFERLKKFLRTASQRGIVVELVLFCPFYKDSMWNLSPMNAVNNVNGIGKVARDAAYDLDKVIGDNETGFKGTGDTHYRMEAWEFLLAGGGLYNNLDYSFAVGHEDGTFKYPDKTPGGGNDGFRTQISVLKKFLEQFDFVRMKPDETVVQAGLPNNGRASVLSEPGEQYAIYFFGGPSVRPSLALAPGEYKADWVSPITGKVLRSEVIHAKQAPVELALHVLAPDIALRIKRVASK